MDLFGDFNVARTGDFNSCIYNNERDESFKYVSLALLDNSRCIWSVSNASIYGRDSGRID